MSKKVYHYTNDSAQNSIVCYKKFHFREITDFNKHNDDEELIINTYFKDALGKLENQIDNDLFNKLKEIDFSNDFDNIFSVKYSIDGLSSDEESDFEYLNNFYDSKVYIASFSFNGCSDDMYNKFSSKSKTILEIDLDPFMESIRKELIIKIVKSFSQKNSTVMKKCMNKNMRASFEGVIGKDLVYENKVFYNRCSKIDAIIEDIYLKKYVLENSPITLDAKFMSKLAKLIYLDAHNFKEEKFAFEDEVRLILFIPKTISDMLKVENNNKDKIQLKFEKKCIKKIPYDYTLRK